jgi:NADH dehydrogenase FAD-containing subunit
VAGAGPARRALASIVDPMRVKLHIGRVADLDLRGRRATFTDASSEAFDELVVATGSVAALRGVPGIEHAWSCETEENALALRDHLTKRRSSRIVVVGGGLTGVELASELAEQRRDVRVTLVTSGEVGFMLAERARAHVRTALRRLGADVREQQRVVAVERDAVVLASGDVLPCDATIWCAGLEPTALARETGLDVDERGRARVDAHLRSTSHDFVRVIGDAARVELPGRNETLRMACATANPQGAFCADDVAADLRGRSRRPFSFAYAIQCLSLGRRDGIMQRVDAWDGPRALFFGGRPGAWFKEFINRYAFGSVRLERRGIGYSWPKAPALPASETRPMLVTRNP